MHRLIKKPFFPSQSATGLMPSAFFLKATPKLIQTPLTNNLTHYTRFFSTLSSSYRYTNNPVDEPDSESGPVFTWPWMWLDEFAGDGQEPEPRFTKLPEVYSSGVVAEEMETFETMGAGDSFAAPDGLIVEGPAK